VSGKGHGENWTFDKVLDLFPGLAPRLESPGNQLSGGEQQMLAVGRALMTNPKLLILDEATEGLAPLIRKEIWSCLADLKTAKQSILVTATTSWRKAEWSGTAPPKNFAQIKRWRNVISGFKIVFSAMVRCETPRARTMLTKYFSPFQFLSSLSPRRSPPLTTTRALSRYSMVRKTSSARR